MALKGLNGQRLERSKTQQTKKLQEEWNKSTFILSMQLAARHGDLNEMGEESSKLRDWIFGVNDETVDTFDAQQFRGQLMGLIAAESDKETSPGAIIEMCETAYKSFYSEANG